MNKNDSTDCPVVDEVVVPPRSIINADVMLVVVFFVDGVDDKFRVEKFEFAGNPAAAVCSKKLKDFSGAFRSLMCRVIPKYFLLELKSTLVKGPDKIVDKFNWI